MKSVEVHLCATSAERQRGGDKKREEKRTDHVYAKSEHAPQPVSDLPQRTGRQPTATPDEEVGTSQPATAN